MTKPFFVSAPSILRFGAVIRVAHCITMFWTYRIDLVFFCIDNARYLSYPKVLVFSLSVTQQGHFFFTQPKLCPGYWPPQRATGNTYSPVSAVHTIDSQREY